VYRRLSLIQVIILFHMAFEYIVLTTPGAEPAESSAAQSTLAPMSPSATVVADVDAPAESSYAVAQMLAKQYGGVVGPGPVSLH
jgi:hypothetical protein